jgi:hypothetical protein
MALKTVPVTGVDPAMVLRLDDLLRRTAALISDAAAPALNRSVFGRLAISEFLDRYESRPAELAGRLGFACSSEHRRSTANKSRPSPE